MMGEAYPHLVAQRDEVIATIEREEAQFARTLDAGSRLLERRDRRRRSATRERVVGRRPEDLPSDAPRPAGRGRVPAPRHVRLPGRPDRRARRRIRRRHRSRRASRRRSPSSANGVAPGKKAELAKHAELELAVQRDPGAAPATRRSSATRRPPPRAGSSPSFATGMEFEELTGHGRGRARPRPDAVLRRGRRPGRRPGRHPRSRAAAASCSR